MHKCSLKRVCLHTLRRRAGHNGGWGRGTVPIYPRVCSAPLGRGRTWRRSFTLDGLRLDARARRSLTGVRRSLQRNSSRWGPRHPYCWWLQRDRLPPPRRTTAFTSGRRIPDQSVPSSVHPQRPAHTGRACGGASERVPAHSALPLPAGILQAINASRDGSTRPGRARDTRAGRPRHGAEKYLIFWITVKHTGALRRL
jgi:hypothetical protein